MRPYIGSGPYCYANSVAMMLGPAAPTPSVIEVLTGSPFGFQLLGGQLPLFSTTSWPAGPDPPPTRCANSPRRTKSWRRRCSGARPQNGGTVAGSSQYGGSR